MNFIQFIKKVFNKKQCSSSSHKFRITTPTLARRGIIKPNNSCYCGQYKNVSTLLKDKAKEIDAMVNNIS